MKKCIAIFLLSATLMTLLAAPVFAAGNVRDDEYELSSIANLYENQYMVFRPKQDYTSSYIKNDATSGGSLIAWVQRANMEHEVNTAYSSYNPEIAIDRYYGPMGYDNPNSPDYDEFYYGPYKTLAKKVYPGASTYLTNFVKEDGYLYASVVFYPETCMVKYEILWSPDSV